MTRDSRDVSRARTRALRSAALWVALALAAPALLAAPTEPPGSSYVVNDSHFHLTNYVQQGTDIHDFLKIMGTKVGRVALFGIPLQQTWSYGNTGDFAPTYYLQTDAPLYYYSFTDAFIAMAYRSLTPAEQARFDPMITGFNPADMYAADHIKRVLQTFPGVFSGIGEFTIHKEFVSSKIAGRDGEPHEPGARPDPRLRGRGRARGDPAQRRRRAVPEAGTGSVPGRCSSRDAASSGTRRPRSSGRTAASGASCIRSRTSSGSWSARSPNPELAARLDRHLVGRGGEVPGRDAGDDAGGRGPHQPLSRPLPVRHRRGGADRAGEVPEGLRHVRAALREADAGGEREAAQGQLRAALRRGAAQGAGLGEGERPR